MASTFCFSWTCRAFTCLSIFCTLAVMTRGHHQHRFKHLHPSRMRPMALPIPEGHNITREAPNFMATVDYRKVMPSRDDNIYFPGTVPKKSTQIKIPPWIFFNKVIKNWKDFVNNYVNNIPEAAPMGTEEEIPAPVGTEEEFLLPRSNSADDDGSLASMASCQPYETTVELEMPSDSSVIYYPSCVLIERCGGCCMHELLGCVPTKKEFVPIKVMKARYIDESFQQEGSISVEIEKHLECACDCKIKKESCNSLQEYNPSECRCSCINELEASTCSGNSQFWDPGTCTCQCMNKPECSTNFIVDTNTCTCTLASGNAIN